jgi:predicted MFS family arabinose efflux permease
MVNSLVKKNDIDQDGFAVATMLAFLATAGLFYVNIMPALVDGLVKGVGFTVEQAGYITSANIYGAAFGAFAIFWLVHRLNWRLTALITLLIMIAIDFLSTFITDFTTLMAVRFIHGFDGGFLVGLGFSLIARTKSPDRAFGVLLLVQFGLGGLAVIVIPRILDLVGYEVLFYTLIAFSSVTLLTLRYLPDFEVQTKQTKTIIMTPATKSKWRIVVALAMVSIFIFQCANMAIGAFLIPLGEHYGLTTDFSSLMVGVAYWVGAWGSALVIFIGLKYRRLIPIVLAYLLTLAGFLLFHYSDNQTAFAAANFSTAATWAFMMPYLFGICSALDPADGRIAALGGFASKLGLASGPLIGGILIGDSGEYALLINVAFWGLVVGLIVSVSAVFRLRAHQDAMGVSEN